MTTPNHIAGGVAITGISLSFFDINIFSNPLFLGFCIFSSLLPDIDHTKSIIGKVFYPISKYLDMKFGHRTITHSLTALIPTFLFLVFLELNFLNPYFKLEGLNYSLIFLFGYLSHLILDMLTIAGIPLFYPFLRNPCVIPANPNLRFRSGNIKSEAIALLLFTFVIASSFDLFKNGFWTTYNRTFGTLKHVNREFISSSNFLKIDYKYTFNGDVKQGTGILLESTKTSSKIWTNNKIIIIDNKDKRFKNIEVLPSKTKYIYKIKDLDFFNLTLQELNDTLQKKLVSGTISASEDFYNQNNIRSKKINLDLVFSPKFSKITNDSINTDISEKIHLKRLKIAELNKHNSLLKIHKSELKKLKIKLKNTNDLYLKNSIETKILELQQKIKMFKPKSTIILRREIAFLKADLEQKSDLRFNGILKIFEVPPPARSSTRLHSAF